MDHTVQHRMIGTEAILSPREVLSYLTYGMQTCMEFVLNLIPA